MRDRRPLLLALGCASVIAKPMEEESFLRAVHEALQSA